MRKNIRWLICFAIFAILFTGCLTLKPVVRPDGCADSVIYEKVKNPALVGKLIEIANLEVLKANNYNRKKATIAIVTIKNLLEKEPITFSDFMEGVKPIAGKYFKDYGTELIVIDSLLTGIAIDIPIGTCDKGLIIKLCDKMLDQLKDPVTFTYNIRDGTMSHVEQL